ncbi:MAG: hypothetical protein PHN39_02205 [Candidatus Pacebacteria bacterium]|nr:hypothetical protein [Candidatus Paceibacterota bacterium]
MENEFFEKKPNIPEMDFREAEKRLTNLKKALFNIDDPDQRLAAHNKINDHIREILLAKYGQDFCQKTLSFHIFTEGSIFAAERTMMEREDFPGEDSLEKFAEQMLKERENI